ncbi:IQ and AAA domain-containing protein 1-like [Pectinophora gossypiella]|uniref:IQ and AAA domain-containing protein 1-like n=1 Tax=Pectinophora gossypiella TaxID=13191 RepID=UPI00214EB3DC|nr:IQ and AAA domain-containing protein 1-like [Pectinophora gossypiella]
MASKDYYACWLEYKKQLAVALAEDARLQLLAKALVGIKPQATAVEIVARVYTKFCNLYNKLCEIYDQMLQPQRQEYIKKIIDAITCRLLELKSALENVEAFEYTYTDNALQQMLMVPQDVQILCPFFYPFEIRQQELQYIVDQILAGNRLGDPSPTASEIERREEERLEEERIKQEEKDAEIRRKLALGEDIIESEPSIIYTPAQLEAMRKEEEYTRHTRNIQRMERARSITFFKIQKKGRDLNLYLDLAGLKKPKAREPLRARAVALIQTVYRKFMYYKREHLKEEQLKAKLGMIITACQPPSATIQLEKVKEARRVFRRAYYKKWIDENVKERTKILRWKEGEILEDISAEIRQWFKEWYDEVKVFDEFPWPDEGGSILVVRGDTFTLEEYIEWKKAEEIKQKKEAQNPKTKEDIKAEKLAAREEKRRIAREAKEKEKKRILDYKKMRLNPDNDPGVYIDIGKNVDQVQDMWFNYENQWKALDVPGPAIEIIKGHIMELITENKYQEIQLEFRPIVDEMMRLELNLLKASLKIDYAFAGAKIPITKKRKKPKKVKPPKPEKTPPAVLFQKLVDAGIVVKYPHTTLNDYWGDRNFAAADTRAIPWVPTFPPPCMGDVQEQVRIRCLLTLGSNCSNAVRSQLLVGPKHSGKRTLAYAIATETNSILMDLSPMYVYDKMPGAKGLKTMFNLVNRVSRIMQPTVILVDGADRLFYKKVPKEEKIFDPTRLSKDFFKEIVKPLKGPDKVLVIGTASEPWLAKTPQMRKAFPSVILLPRTEYASISFILTKVLMRYHGIDRDFNVHSVAQALRGYDISTILKSVRNVLNGKRIAELKYKPLHPMELVNAVLDNEGAVCTEAFDYEQFKTWYLSYSPFGGRYVEYMTMLESQLACKLKAEKQKKKK